VLVPQLIAQDENIDYYYDFSQSISEYEKTFAELNICWQWQPVTLQNYADIIKNIVYEKSLGVYFPIVLNLCDGDEINGTPGISVVKLLKKRNLAYTGANDYFYNITTSKSTMKKVFDKSKVSTPLWEAIHSAEQNMDGIFERLGSPIIVKPSISGGSMGVGIKNVVNNETELKEQIKRMFAGYRGWNLCADGIIAEAFVAGPEFTVFIIGSYFNKEEALVYTPVERIFHNSLPVNQRFLSFDRLWEIYEEETAMPNDENFYEYALPDKNLIENIKKISWDAYVATKGVGYARADIRMDAKTGRLYVLEINAQCGLSEDENYTSIGAILRLSNVTFTQAIVKIINDAFAKTKAKLTEKAKSNA
jgi:D-alanine-D-alanine ligase